MGRCREEMCAVGTLWIESRPGKQKMCEHVLSRKMTIGSACRADKFCYLINHAPFFLSANSRPGMSRNGGVGVYVRRQVIGEFSEIACAADTDGF